jgi:hypothetical protein
VCGDIRPDDRQPEPGPGNRWTSRPKMLVIGLGAAAIGFLIGHVFYPTG